MLNDHMKYNHGQLRVSQRPDCGCPRGDKRCQGIRRLDLHQLSRVKDGLVGEKGQRLSLS